MRYQLIAEPNKKYSALEQILVNRGLDYNEIQHYINTTDDDINSPLGLGETALKNAVSALISTIHYNGKCAVIVDADCDGYCSSAILINYLYDLFPSWVENNLKWYLHSGKQHGLNDLYNEISKEYYQLVIIPDAGRITA